MSQGVQSGLDLADAIELAELLTLLAEWSCGREGQTLADSLARHLGSPGYDLPAPRNDLHRIVFLLGLSDGHDLFDGPTPSQDPRPLNCRCLTGSPV